jgi:hypothetical protein
MNVRIMIDLDRVHPVSGNRWHRAMRLRQLPQPGELITTLCGKTEEAEYAASTEQTLVVETCWLCDLVYRRQHGIPVLPDHPGLRPI